MCFSFRRPELKLLATNHRWTKPSESLTSSPGPLQAVPVPWGGTRGTSRAASPQ